MPSTPTTEDEFADQLAELLKSALAPHRVERKRSLLYDLSIDHLGKVTMGVDPDSGEPIRGRGRGFEQDILVFDEVADSYTSVIPRIVAEIKFGSVTTHDVIVYSEKADRIRRVYPYIRYGFILGGMKSIPGRVLRLGQRFDFIASVPSDLSEPSVAQFCSVMREEAATSIQMTELLFGKRKANLFRRKLVVE
ncbi:MAG: hypothetical protein SH850_03760 [Planctomycetaceae bacterium]|nr:hypothetical protein [Planctomycetaceae bacterium]